MRSLSFAVALLLTSILCQGCSDHSSHGVGPGTVSLTEQGDLFKSWTHSQEEDPDGGFQVYRSSSSMAFPPSWFRQVYVFNQDGTGMRLVLHAADAHYMESMSWFSDDIHPNRIHIKDVSGNALVSFEIVELTPEILRILPVESNAIRP